MEKYKPMWLVSFDFPGNTQKVKSILNERLNSGAAIRFSFQVAGNSSFVMLNPELMMLISSIYQKNTRLLQLTSSIPEGAIEQFGYSTLVEEIQQTNEVENVHSTRKEIRAALNEMHEGGKSKRFAGMVRKYHMLLSHQEIPLQSCADIRRLYDDFILDEVIRENPENKPDGVVFRKDKTSVYSQHDQKIHDGLYPENRIMESMELALGVLNDSAIDPLIRIAVFHYMFAYIHPFYDGNGRMTRFISSYMLSKTFAESVCLRIALVIKDHRPKYYKLFKETNEARNFGDLTYFVIGFLSFIEQAMEDTYLVLLEKKKRYDRAIGQLENAINQVYPTISGDMRIAMRIMLQCALFGDKYISMKSLEAITSHDRRTIDKVLTASNLFNKKKDGHKYWWYIDLDVLAQYDP